MAEETDLLWIDLETTGLLPSRDVPLELGLVLTDRWGGIKAERSWLIMEDTAFTDSLVRAYNDVVVNKMHTESGLWDALESDEFSVSRYRAQTLACDWLTENEVRFGTLPMTGSSIGSLDRPFVQYHFPELNRAFNYRNVDISSVKEICKRVNPELFEKLKETIDTKAGAKHRVLDDIHASIREYKAYLDNFLWTE